MSMSEGPSDDPKAIDPAVVSVFVPLAYRVGIDLSP